jgi:hypothetical protein
MRLQRIRIGVHIDDGAETGMLRRAMVTLEVILEHRLPVRATRPLLAMPELKLVGVETTPGNEARQLAEDALQRVRPRIGIYEDPRTPRVEP